LAWIAAIWRVRGLAVSFTAVGSGPEIGSDEVEAF
jgi:hypothetical protein